MQWDIFDEDRVSAHFELCFPLGPGLSLRLPLLYHLWVELLLVLLGALS